MTDKTQTNNEWETVIGLEVHVQLATKSKIFSGASTTYGAEPNTQACIVDLAFPGVLPVLNHSALNMAIKFGLSIGAQVNKKSVFARKNYFYPDLPKGYQISQHELPIVGIGKLDIILEDGEKLSIGVTRAHLEEDAGKSIHEGLQGVTGVDLNRAGTPLLEVVSEPDMRSAKEAVAYLKTLHSLVRYLEICDGNMQEGSFRCDANVSVRKKGAELGTRTEVKNVNSFRYVERAILHEVDRQIEILEDGGKIVQETRLYDPSKDETRSMRAKEEAHDYRYFPDPDLLPVEITDADIEKIRAQIPELPWEKRQRFEDDFKLNKYDASLLTSNLALSKFFEQTCAANNKVPAKIITNWLTGEMAAALNREHLSIEKSPISPKQLNDLSLRIHDQTISNSIGKQVFAALWQGEGEVDAIIEQKGLKQMNNSDELLDIIEKILDNNPTQIAAYHGGKDKLFGFFVGQAMKATKGRANPAQINELIKQQLEKRKE